MSTNAEVRLGPQNLRGIAHPLRVRLLGVLREDGPSTATRLAERLGQSSGATSYHLRQLAAYGFVVEETDRGAGRERWWRAAHRSTTLNPSEIRDAEIEAEIYLRAVAAELADRVDRWLGELATRPAQWRDGSTLSDWLLRLSPDEAARLRRELVELVGRYRSEDADTDPPPGTERVVLQVQLMPFLGTRADG